MEKKLTRSVNDKMLGGVCSGLAKYFGLDPTLVRLGYAFLSIFTAGFPGIVLYIMACIIIPKDTAI